jgi:hypothetical protein
MPNMCVIVADEGLEGSHFQPPNYPFYNNATHNGNNHKK